MVQIREYEINEARDAVDEGETPGDMKAGSSGIKSPVYYISPAMEIYGGRAHQYGEEKYAKGNYLRPQLQGTDLDRMLDYIAATKRHLSAAADSIIRYIGKGRNAQGDANKAAFAPDKESKLPHLAHAVASLSMLLQQAVDSGLLPEDPGVTWRAR